MNQLVSLRKIYRRSAFSIGNHTTKLCTFLSDHTNRRLLSAVASPSAHRRTCLRWSEVKIFSRTLHPLADHQWAKERQDTLIFRTLKKLQKRTLKKLHAPRQSCQSPQKLEETAVFFNMIFIWSLATVGCLVPVIDPNLHPTDGTRSRDASQPLNRLLSLPPGLWWKATLRAFGIRMRFVKKPCWQTFWLSSALNVSVSTLISELTNMFDGTNSTWQTCGNATTMWVQ